MCVVCACGHVDSNEGTCQPKQLLHLQHVYNIIKKLISAHINRHFPDALQLYSAAELRPLVQLLSTHMLQSTQNQSPSLLGGGIMGLVNFYLASEWKKKFEKHWMKLIFVGAT